MDTYYIRDKCGSRYVVGNVSAVEIDGGVLRLLRPSDDFAQVFEMSLDLVAEYGTTPPTA